MEKGLFYLFYPEGNEDYGNKVIKAINDKDYIGFMNYYKYDNFSNETSTYRLPETAMDTETGEEINITEIENFNRITEVDVE